jgi:hypothetical protein
MLPTDPKHGKFDLRTVSSSKVYSDYPVQAWQSCISLVQLLLIPLASLHRSKSIYEGTP